MLIKKNVGEDNWIHMVSYKKNGKCERKLELGIIGVGKVGSLVVNQLLKKYPDININLNSRDDRYLRLLLPDMAKIEIDGREIPTNQTLSRLRVYETVDGKVTVGDSKKRLLDSDIIILAARKYREAYFKERSEEYLYNKELIDDIGRRLEGFTGVLVDLTNPLELTCERLAQISKIPREKIVGVAYSSTIRFRDALQSEIKKNSEFRNKKINLENAVVIGEHGANMVPIYHGVIIGDKRLSQIPNTENMRRRIRKAVKKVPAESQSGDTSAKNIFVPSMAVVYTIEALLEGYQLPMSSFDGDCFITNKTRSVSLEGKIERIEPIKKFLEKGSISNSERIKYKKAKEEIIKKLKKVGLIK